MASLDHCDSSNSACTSASATSSITPSSIASIDEDLSPATKPDPPFFQEGYKSALVPPFYSTHKVSLSKSYSGLSDLVKTSTANSITLRPSPSLSTLQEKTRSMDSSDIAGSDSHPRRVSNPLSDRNMSDAPRSHSQVVPLAERRRSQTSRYLGTDDFKSTFAINLSKVKQREKPERVALPRWGDPLLKRSEATDIQPFSDSSQVRGNCLDTATESRLVQSERLDLCSSPNPIAETDNQAVQIPSDAFEISSMVREWISLPTKELAARLEMHFRRIKQDRVEEELEARNEVISILAHQLSNQLEANEKLLHELGALRAAYASLQASCSDYVDELELLKTRSREEGADQEMQRSRKEAENKIRDLRQLLEESKVAIGRLQVEVRNQGHRRSLQNYYTGERINATSVYQGQTNDLKSQPTKRSTVLVLSSVPRPGESKRAAGTSILEKLVAQFETDNSRARSDSITQRLPTLTFLTNRAIGKPQRPPKSAARSTPSSPAPVHVRRRRSSNCANMSTQTADLPELGGLEILKQRCAQLELELNKSEDCRKASQVALNGLRDLISSQPASVLSSMKLPPLPTDAESAWNPQSPTGEESGGRWSLSHLLSGTGSRKANGTAPNSPNPNSPSIKCSPGPGSGFGGFSLWSRSPVLG